jgi:hypothetical protein
MSQHSFDVNGITAISRDRPIHAKKGGLPNQAVVG